MEVVRGNVYGVYDLSGCVNERTASYITNDSEVLIEFGKSFTQNNASTKWVTRYPYNTTNDTNLTNYTAYRDMLSSSYGYGDSIYETSKQVQGNNAWNSDLNDFPSGNNPFMTRGGNYSNTSSAGEFAYSSTDGGPDTSSGFRVVLVVE